MRSAYRTTSPRRGNARQDIFVTDALRRLYLGLIAEHAQRNHLRVLAFCLMSNHVHLVVWPETEDSMANTFLATRTRGSRNTGTPNINGSGHLWQNRYYSCPVEEIALWRVARYVEQNPVRAGLVDRAVDYEW